MKEVELAKHFVDYLSDYDLYFEIPNLNTDIVAKDGKILMSFEVKTTLNFRVIEQAQFNTHYFHYSYICVPWNKDKGFARNVCKMYGIGILGIKMYSDTCWGDVWEVEKPKLNRHASKINNYTNSLLKDYTKRSIPGASGGDGTTLTPFKITVENVVKYVKRHPDATIKEVIENIDHHYSSFTGAKSTLYQWIRSGVITEFYFEKGIVKLTENSTS